MLPGIIKALGAFYLEGKGVSMKISKRIENEKVPNMRDLGGMIGADGKKIRSGLLIRSQQLINASEKDKAMLAALPLRKIFDFRNPKEAMEKPDPCIKGCSYMNLSIIDESTVVSWESNRSEKSQKDMEAAQNDPEAGAKQMCEIYRNFVRTPFSRKKYGEFLQEILDTEDGAVLWHCTLGKDRCGWGSVLVQAVLGVCPETIMEDYLFTNVCLKDEIAGMMETLKKISKGTSLANSGSALVEARAEYLEAAYDEIEKMYGSMDAFLEKGLGVDAAMKDRFRARYLE